MMIDQRNQVGLNEYQVQHCREIWEILGGTDLCELETNQAAAHLSRTRFVESQNVVYLGADAFPGTGVTVRSSLSPIACLAHELGHARRFEKGYSRPVELPDVWLDEAEASLEASFVAVLSQFDRRSLVEDAREQVERWLIATA